jgi:hypothetical protein
MTQQHPITPPPELVEQWMQDHATKYDLARHAVEWGADQELDACCEWINSFQNKFVHAHDLRLVRRPKPPSLKELALEALDEEQAELSIQNYKLIRAVLESLPDHE